MAQYKIKIAGLQIAVTARYPLTEQICAPYRSDSPFTDFSVYVTPAQIREKQKTMPIRLTEEQAECICLNEQISLRLLRFDAFLLHAAVLQYQGKTYAFAAPRGKGKSTHAGLWKSSFGPDVIVINGDKPIIRRQKDGRFFAYGTPWCGKEGDQTNMGAVLDCITFIEQASSNSVRLATEEEYLDRLIGQVVFPCNEVSMNRGAKLLAEFMRATPAAVAFCNMREDAAAQVHRFWNEK